MTRDADDVIFAFNAFIPSAMCACSRRRPTVELSEKSVPTVLQCFFVLVSCLYTTIGLRFHSIVPVSASDRKLGIRLGYM